MLRCSSHTMPTGPSIRLLLRLLWERDICKAECCSAVQLTEQHIMRYLRSIPAFASKPGMLAQLDETAAANLMFTNKILAQPSQTQKNSAQ